MKFEKIMKKHSTSWEIIDEDHIGVSYYGGMDEHFGALEKELRRVGLHAVIRTYDKKNKTTTTIYKRTKVEY